jgi:hypothetical protein
MYIATHFHNFYHVTPLDEVDRVIEELALWGGNMLQVWFDMHHFKSLQDPAAQKHVERLKHFAETAHGVGIVPAIVGGWGRGEGQRWPSWKRSRTPI